MTVAIMTPTLPENTKELATAMITARIATTKSSFILLRSIMEITRMPMNMAGKANCRPN
ncbi:hypothetical protein D3C76_1769060 [compost metagenome]